MNIPRRFINSYALKWYETLVWKNNLECKILYRSYDGPKNDVIRILLNFIYSSKVEIYTISTQICTHF